MSLFKNTFTKDFLYKENFNKLLQPSEAMPSWLLRGWSEKLTSHKACVRDVSWHPFEEKIVSSSVRILGLGDGGQCVSGT